MVGDFMRLQECLVNLLGNANKFTHSGEITLGIRCELVEGQEWVVFRVTDTGIGMTPDQQVRLFRPYHTLQKQGSRSYRGAGLGLVISRELCRLMGGTLELEASEPGKGSTFRMRVPAYGGPPSRASILAHGPRPRILAIDDDPQVLNLLEGLLAQEGFELLTATNGKQGFLLAEKERPQAITLDVLLPDMDGWAVLTQLKGNPETANIPVIMLTVLGESSTGQALGAVATLAKPLDRENLLDVLRTCRENHEPRPVLVVDDDAAFRGQIRTMLESDGWSVVEAGDGREALAHLKRRPPALILLDLVMPGLDGGAFVEELSRHPNWEQIPVVLVTATPLVAAGLETRGKAPLGGCIRRILNKCELTAERLQREVRSAAHARVEG
jgi:CheY-like chemotaxis protein